MRVDLATLGTFSELAREGSERAADSLSQLVGGDAQVDVTRVEVVSVSDLALEFSGTSVVGVEIGYDGGIEGTVLQVFDRESAETLLGEMIPVEGDLDEATYESGVTEAANILVGGFLAAWGEHFGAKLTPAPPEYVDGEWEAIMPARAPVWTEHQTVLAFSSRLRAADETVDFRIYMFPERESFERVVREAGDGGPTLSLDELSAFNEMTREGARRASDKLSTMADLRTLVDVSRLTVVPIDELVDHVPDRRRIGAVARLTESPGGFVALAFDVDSARTVADALLPMEVEGEGFTAQHRAAIEEIGNIAVSGFVDGWANLAERTIAYEPPEFVDEEGGDAIREHVAELDAEGYAFFLESSVRTPGADVSCTIFAVPTASGLEEIISELSLEDVAEAIYDPEHLEPGEYDELS